MKKLGLFFRSIKWYEYLFLCVCLAVYVTLGVVFESGIITILSSIFGFLSVFFITKGNVLGQMLGLIYLSLYAYVAYSASYFGEFIICLAISAPIYIVTIFAWVKNLSNGAGEVRVKANLKRKEWLVVSLVVLLLSVGVYFLLQYFHTSQVLLNTVSVATSMLAGYVVMRRCAYGFIFYISNNIICLIMWALLVAQTGDLANIITIFNFAMYFVLNSKGVWNFIKLKNKQNSTFDKIIKIIKEG